MERDRAGEALRESEERYRYLVQHVSAGIFRVDFTTGRFTEVNDVMCQLLGYTRDGLLALTAFDILDDEGKVNFAARVRRAQSGETLNDAVEYRVRTKDGRMIWGLLNVMFRWAGGKIVGAMVVAHDITERKKMEEKLQITLRRFYLILSSMNFGILLVTDDNRVEFINKAFCDIFNLKDSPDDLAKLSANEMIDKIRLSYAVPDSAIARIRDIVDAGQPVRNEGINMSGDRFFLRDFIPIRIDGKMYGRLWVHMDITERKRAEEAMTFQSRILSEVHDAVFSSDRNFTINYWNQAAEKMFGWTKEEVLGRNFGELLKPKVENSTRDKQRSKLRSPGQWVTQVQYTRKDGTYFFVEVNSSVWRDADGKDVGNVVVARDITDRKRAEEALRDSEARFKAIAEATPVGIGVVGLPDATLLYVNPAYLKGFGYEESEILGKGTPQIYWSNEERDRALAILKEKGSVAEYEVKLKRKDGTPFWGLSSVRPITFNGKPALLGSFVDITGRKIAEDKLKQASEELHRSNEELAFFNNAMVGRELRMIELKKEINQLCHQFGQPLRYNCGGEGAAGSVESD